MSDDRNTLKFQWLGQRFEVVKTPCHDCPSCAHIERLSILGPEDRVDASGEVAELLWHVIAMAAPSILAQSRLR